MNSTRATTGQTQRKITAFFLLICTFLLAANFSTWRANATAPVNMRTSVIGIAVMEAISQAEEPLPTSKLNLSQADLVGRMIIPATSQPYLTLPLESNEAIQGSMDEVVRTPSGLKLRGWIFIPGGLESAEFVIAAESGKVIGSLKVNKKRPDVAKALENSEALLSGYDGQMNAPLDRTSCNIRLFVLTSTLTLHPMPSACDKADISTH